MTTVNDQNTSKCECKLCSYSQHVREIIDSRNVDKLIELVNELHDANYNIGFDLNYYKSIMDGSYPSSVQVLEKALENAKKVTNESSGL